MWLTRLDRVSSTRCRAGRMYGWAFKAPLAVPTGPVRAEGPGCVRPPSPHAECAQSLSRSRVSLGSVDLGSISGLGSVSLGLA